MRGDYFARDCSGSDFIIALTLSMLIVVANAFPESTFLMGVFSIVLAAGSFVCYGKHYNTYINSKGIICISWIGSIGLSLLRIHPDQMTWSFTTLLCIIITLPLFFFGYDIYHHYSLKTSSSKYARTILDKDKTFTTLTVLSLVIVVAFFADCIYSRGLPILSNSQSAYMDFGMPYVHYITVCCCLVFPLFYCCCRHFGLRLRDKKSTLCLAITCSAIPIVIVSRQLLLLELVFIALSINVYGGYENRITLKKIVAAIAIVLMAWVLLSLFRDQSTAYLASVFNLPPTTSPAEMSLWQLYLYIGFNFDNFDYLVGHLTEFSYGANTSYPFVVFTAGKSLISDDLISSVGLRALPTFTTYPFIEPAYRDFGILGVILYPFIIGAVSNYVEYRARTNTTPVSQSVYSLFLYSLMISFFTSEFAQPVFFFYLFILLVFALSVNRHSHALSEAHEASATKETL